MKIDCQSENSALLEQHPMAHLDREYERAILARNTTLDQYTRCIYALDRIFAIEGDRSYLLDGIGSCNIDGTRDDTPGLGSAIYDWGDLRQDRFSTEAWTEFDESRKQPCPYHIPDVGCSLGHLKAPVCSAYATEEMLNRLPPEFSSLGKFSGFSGGLFIFLARIQIGSDDSKVLEKHEKFVEEFLKRANAIENTLRKRAFEKGEKSPLV